ncbi:MAG: cytochrome c oxidase subunit II [Chloroflexota bacterium]
MRKLFYRFTFLLILCLMSGCAGSPSFLQPASPIASAEADLYRTLFVVSVVVFVIVEGLLLYVVMRFRKRPGREITPLQQYRAYFVEALYTLIPVVVVVVIFILTLRTMQTVAAPPEQAGDVNIHVLGHQWWWEFDYPDQDVITANELHIPVNTNVYLTLDTVDVIHSFYVPQLSGKTDVMAGMTNHMWLRGDTVGEYHGQCAEYCGLNHANMRFTVFVDTPQDYQAWITNQQQPPPDPQTPMQKDGQNMIVNGICGSCHLLGEEGPEHVAPNLTHLFSRSRFAGDTFDLNEENLRKWLLDNQAMKPGNDMIHIKDLPQSHIDALVSYLMQLK